MNTLFDREEALKKLRLVVFEKRAVATLTASGGNLGENQGAASRKVNILSGGALGGSRSSIYEGAGGSNTNALLSASKVVPQPRMQRVAMRAPSPPSAARMGMGVQKSPGGQLSVGKVSKRSTKIKAPTANPMSMGKAAHIVALQKEAGAGFIARGLSLLGRGARSAKGSFMKGYGTPAAPKAVPDAAPKAADGVDKAFDFAKRVFSSESPRAALRGEFSQATKGLGEKALKGAARFAYKRGKSATGFGTTSGGAAMTYSAIKNPDLTLKQHAARAAPYAAGGMAFGAGGPLLLGAPAAAIVKPSVEKYLRSMTKKVKNPKTGKMEDQPVFKSPRLSMISDFGKKTGLLESDAARRRRTMRGLASMTAKDIRNLKI